MSVAGLPGGLDVRHRTRWLARIVQVAGASRSLGWSRKVITSLRLPPRALLRVNVSLRSASRASNSTVAGPPAGFR